MFGTVHHIGYLTDDAGRDVALYERAFGGKVAAQRDTPDGGKMVFVRFGDSEVELIEPGDKSRLGGRPGLVLDHVSYFVDDIDKAIEQLRAGGVQFQPGPTVNMTGDRMIFLDTGSSGGTRIHLTEARKR